MSQFPALPLFVREYRMDTLHLSTTQHGAYLLLLMQAWGSPQCRLPDCDEKLAAWANLSLADWGSLRHSLEPFFTICGGWWTQKRLSHEWHFVYDRQKAARSRAKKGGIAKALKYKKIRDAASTSQAVLEQTLSSAASVPPTPTPTKEDSSLRSESKTKNKKLRFLQKDAPDGAKTNTRNIKILEGQEPTPSQIQAATKAGLSEAERRTEWGKFRAYNVAKGSAFADWGEVWQIWLAKRPELNSHDPLPFDQHAAIEEWWREHDLTEEQIAERWRLMEKRSYD